MSGANIQAGKTERNERAERNEFFWKESIPAIPSKAFGTKWRIPVKLDKKRKV